MSNNKETFAGLMHSFAYRYDLRTVFDDFLTMSFCSLSQNPKIGKSYYEDFYLETAAKYKNDTSRFLFPKMFGCLVNEMENRIGDDKGNDVLGEFFEQNLSRKNSGQIFTPWPICTFMAKATATQIDEVDSDRPRHILDPACGSGRMLLTAAKEHGREHRYFGIDIDHTCVLMTAINLFLNGIFHSEVLCADALAPEDFRCSYRISFVPLGIFKIEDKEKSFLWHLLRESLRKPPPENNLKLPSELRKEHSKEGTQLTFF